MKVTGAILAGGRATRFGGLPKGLEVLGGTRIIDRVWEAVSQVCEEVILVANHPGATGWLPGVPVVPDVIPGHGALSGVHAALAHAQGPVIAVAWDMPFVTPGVLARLRARAEWSGADVVVPESPGPRGVEPLCAYYGPACRMAIEAAFARGDERMIGFYDVVQVERIAADAIAALGDPAILFANVNAPDDLLRLALGTPLPAVAFVGRKDSGKTTTLVRVAASLAARGRRVGTLKHGSHDFSLDPAGTDTYRHWEEGGAHKVAMVSPQRFAYVERRADPADPRAIIAQHFAGCDIVLCEGFKGSDLPRIEVHRRAVHPAPIYRGDDPRAPLWRGVVTDDPAFTAHCPVIRFDHPTWIGDLVALVEKITARA